MSAIIKIAFLKIPGLSIGYGLYSQNYMWSMLDQDLLTVKFDVNLSSSCS